MKLLLSIYCFAFLGCMNKDNSPKVYFYIPKDYTGWVNIIFEDPSSSNDPIIEDKNYVYFINKTPEKFTVRSKPFPQGSYKESYFYYNTDTSIKLKDVDYPGNNIFFTGFVIIHGDEKRELRPKTVYSFYVSKVLLNMDSLSVDKFPKNQLLMGIE